MAIAHVVFKSSSTAPPAAMHAEYLLRGGQYRRRGKALVTDSGNLPEFAAGDARAFWAAADTHERANGRAYTEIQLALPRELDELQREGLAREVAREFMGNRFAYTLAIHSPVARDNIDQPHLHLMFSERAIDETSRALPKERFFARNGAKKDRSWNERSKPEEIRQRWCDMMNRAMEEAGSEERVDPRSYKDMGRGDLQALREPKLLAGSEKEAKELRAEVDVLREARAELPPAHLDREAAAAWIGKETDAELAKVEQRYDEEMTLLDRAIAALKEATAKAVAVVTEKADTLRGFFSKASAFTQKTNAEIDRKKQEEMRAAEEAKARAVESIRRVPKAEDLETQLRRIARSQARDPERKIDHLRDIPGVDFAGKVLGYTSGDEEALVESWTGKLVRVPTQGKRPVEVGKRVELDRRTGGMGREGHSR